MTTTTSTNAVSVLRDLNEIDKLCELGFPHDVIRRCAAKARAALAASAPAQPDAPADKGESIGDDLEYQRRLHKLVVVVGNPHVTAEFVAARDSLAAHIDARTSASAKDAEDAARYRYVRDTGTLETAVWEALDGYGCAQEGELDQAAYAAGMDRAIDAARAAIATTKATS